MKNVWFFLLLIMGSLTIVSCGEDDENGHMHDDTNYDAAIVINSPAENDEVTVGEAVHIDVDITRPDNKIIHNVKIEVMDADGNVAATLVDDHAHEEGAYKFHGNAFTPDGHGAYKMVVTTTNDDGENAVSEEVNFTAKHGAGNGEYKVMIDIAKPADNAIIAINTAMEVDITFTHETAGERIHNVIIDVVDADGNQVLSIFEDHVHSDVPFQFTKADAWTPDAAGTYRLRAMTTDFEGMNMNMVMKELTVQ